LRAVLPDNVYQRLNPLGLAVAAGVTWLLGPLLFGFSTVLGSLSH
jgi:hypothetical protein